jgi:hypothetical protein
MKLLIALCAFAWICLGSAAPSLAAPKPQRGYMLRDTTSLPPPAPGMARLVVSRDMRIHSELKPEFLYVDRTPVGFLAQLTAVTTEVSPGWHHVWFGRGSPAEVWMEFVPDARYLLRLREIQSGNGTWRADLVREGADGYAQFALGRGMQLSVMDERGRGALERNLGHPSNAEKADSTAREKARADGALPIVIHEVWGLPIPSDAPATVWQNHSGTLTVDDQSLRLMRADTLVVAIPRDSVTSVYFGSQKGGQENPWIKVGYRENGVEKGVALADANRSTATWNYNRLFAELVKRMMPPASP